MTTTCFRRVALAAALLGPVIGLLVLTPAQAQIGSRGRLGPSTPPPIAPPPLPTPRPLPPIARETPFIPPPPADLFKPAGPPPKEMYEFRCGRCNAYVGRGTDDDRAEYTRCPKCGVRFTNTARKSTAKDAGSDPAMDMEWIDSTDWGSIGLLLLGVLFIGLAVAAGVYTGIWALRKVNAKNNTSRRRPRSKRW